MSRILALGLITAGLFAQNNVKDPDDRYYGQDSHAIPACNPTGKAVIMRTGPLKGKKVWPARCQCHGMVHKIQQERTDSCWESALGPLGSNISREMREQSLQFLMLATKELLLACIGEIPDHCTIVAKSPGTWGYDGRSEDTCRTGCWPQNCLCPDSACKSHEESDAY
jgi:hypothetical protein